MSRSSRLQGFYNRTLEERRAMLADWLGLPAEAVNEITSGEVFRVELADVLVENAIGTFALPLAIAANFRINGRDRLVPMVIEESSVVAASSHAAKLLREGEGIVARATEQQMIGQLQLIEVPQALDLAELLARNESELIAMLNANHPRLGAVGGGARTLEARRIDDGSRRWHVVHLVVDVADAMGANIVNTMLERLAPRLEELSGARVHLKILSNLSDRRRVDVVGRVPIALLAPYGESGRHVAENVELASRFAEVDPYRAATHNKGIMNGVDATLLATGQDFRAVEAGAHAYAARNGRYSALSTWRVEEEALVGRMTIPLAVGTVGGMTVLHPAVNRILEWFDLTRARELAEVVAAVGLAQNLAALLALSTEGIQRGHMSLHARNVAFSIGARGDELEALVASMSRENDFSERYASELLADLRATHG
ncbi:MAG: hydroxymethylglutaryl-CoA reductase, degradative [Myxococcales bacterium]|nr:hydroxymethylglutaryl-CoA reductase, degradative [Myxococcales bacterium]